MSEAQHFDVLILGGGMSYVGAIRAAQLGLKVGLVEREAHEAAIAQAFQPVRDGLKWQLANGLRRGYQPPSRQGRPAQTGGGARVPRNLTR